MMSLRMSVDQLEQMKTHELADLLANIVLVLRRMPDVPCTQLQQNLVEPEGPPSHIEKKSTGKKNNTVIEAQVEQATSLPVFTEAELKKKKVADLQTIVATLHIPTSSKKKDDLISKILAKQGQEHSEQFAIQHI